MDVDGVRKRFQGKTVFITGHTGFKGGWLSLWLKSLGATVVGFSLPPLKGQNCFFNAVGLAQEMTSVFADIRDLSTLTEIMGKHQPDIVFHLAAQALVRRSYREPVETYATNVIGTVNVLEAIRSTPSVRAALVITSDKCYHNSEWPWGYRENDPMGGHDPYSSSKGCAELVLAAYRNSFFSEKSSPKIASARAGNVIGGGDWSDDRLVPDFVRAISSGRPLVLRNPEATRPWQHVLDPLWGYLLLAAKLMDGKASFDEGWNFGPSDASSITVHELATKLIERWGAGETRINKPAGDLHEVNFLRLDCSKALLQLKWQPKLNIAEALQMTVDWYRTYFDTPEKTLTLTRRQIDSYRAKIP